MRIFKKLAGCLAFMVLLIVSIQAANRLLVDDNTYTRIMLHEMYEQEALDVVFLSGSVTYRHLDPAVWDESTGLHSFNCGSSSQRPIDSYHVMREVFRISKPKYCIFSLSYVSFLALPGYASNIQTQILFDYFPFSLNKLSYAYDVYETEQANAWIPFLRKQLPTAAQRASLRDMKDSESYRAYAYDTVSYGYERYAGRGFVFNTNQKTVGRVGELSPYQYARNAINEEQIAYFIKLSALCRDNGCQLLIVDSPVPYANMALQEDYQQVLDFYRELADATGAEWLPMDLAKPELFAIVDSDFYDAVHMNGYAAHRYTAALASFFERCVASGEEWPYEAYFYTDYAELLAANQRVYSTWMNRGDGGDYHAQSTAAGDMAVEYRFSSQAKDTEAWTVLQGYATNAVLGASLIPDDADRLRVEARPVGAAEEYQQEQILSIK